ncbi:hypothetical protein B566_EDAN017725 [Ephemera danica]|nr:hypothetical protein B566_EDAN017725 [Ephemera danica]
MSALPSVVTQNSPSYERNRRFRHLVFVPGRKAIGAKLPSEGLGLNASKSESHPQFGAKQHLQPTLLSQYASTVINPSPPPTPSKLDSGKKKIDTRTETVRIDSSKKLTQWARPSGLTLAKIFESWGEANARRLLLAPDRLKSVYCCNTPGGTRVSPGGDQLWRPYRAQQGCDPGDRCLARTRFFLVRRGGHRRELRRAVPVGQKLPAQRSSLRTDTEYEPERLLVSVRTRCKNATPKKKPKTLFCSFIHVSKTKPYSDTRKLNELEYGAMKQSWFYCSYERRRFTPNALSFRKTKSSSCSEFVRSSPSAPAVRAVAASGRVTGRIALREQLRRLERFGKP